jgi:guanine nucleotide-binding protein subunit alpha
MDSFFEEARRIAAPEYIPTEADVLRARTKTTGIYETRFTMGQLSIQYVPLSPPFPWPRFSDMET